MNNNIILAQAVWWWNTAPSSSNPNNGWYSNTSTIDIANYIQWKVLKTKEWNLILSNEDYTNKFQSKYIVTDINGDKKNDMILSKMKKSLKN